MVAHRQDEMLNQLVFYEDREGRTAEARRSYSRRAARPSAHRSREDQRRDRARFVRQRPNRRTPSSQYLHEAEPAGSDALLRFAMAHKSELS